MWRLNTLEDLRYFSPLYKPDIKKLIVRGFGFSPFDIPDIAVEVFH
jgi:hypothetical protein